MQTVTTIGLDTAKSVFQLHGVDAAGQVVIRRKLKRRYVLAFFQKLPPCLVGIEVILRRLLLKSLSYFMTKANLAAYVGGGALLNSPSNMPLNSSNMSLIHWGASWLRLFFDSILMCSPPPCHGGGPPSRSVCPVN